MHYPLKGRNKNLQNSIYAITLKFNLVTQALIGTNNQSKLLKRTPIPRHRVYM